MRIAETHFVIVDPLASSEHSTPHQPLDCQPLLEVAQRGAELFFRVPTEAITQVQVLTGFFSAEFGR